MSLKHCDSGLSHMRHDIAEEEMDRILDRSMDEKVFGAGK